MAQHASSFLVLAWAAVIGQYDWRFRKIPNVLSLGGCLVGIGVLSLQKVSLTGGSVSSCLLAAGFAMLVTVPAYLLKKLGAGDVKFLVGIALLTSLQTTFNSYVVAALLGGLIAITWCIADRWHTTLPAKFFHRHDRLRLWLAIPARERRMAYGTLFALGLASSIWMERCA